MVKTPTTNQMIEQTERAMAMNHKKYDAVKVYLLQPQPVPPAVSTQQLQCDPCQCTQPRVIVSSCEEQSSYTTPMDGSMNNYWNSRIIQFCFALLFVMTCFRKLL
jgi:hypothetical protein